MFDMSTIVLSKTVSTLIFFTIYVGALVYAFWRPNKAKFDDYAHIPLQDD